jgi:hypothetical protein
MCWRAVARQHRVKPLPSFRALVNSEASQLRRSDEEKPVDTEQIVHALKAERERIQRAIAALGGGSIVSSNGRRGGLRGPRRMSAEARRRISEAQKRRWAKVKRQSKR